MTVSFGGGPDLTQVARAAAEALEGHFTGMWRPLPHQVPPDGDWYGWLLLAGRGAGKTDACAHYMNQHALGPPCIRGPVPHWMSIIAPTLGDAATSCYYGPSGLAAHNPDTKLVAGPGGLSVRWPNGAEAKLFGASGPDDVDRLRSGGNRCFVSGTLVKTLRGDVPIEQVCTTDRVWTRNGLRDVLHAGMTRKAALIWRVETTDGVLEGTPDHEVLTTRGWREMQFVTPDDTLYVWQNSSCQRKINDSAPIIAVVNTTSQSDLIIKGDHARNGCALCAVALSPPSSETKPRLAHARVLQSSLTDHVESVYDLQIAHDHEFFANGHVVANCLAWLEELAAWRYMDDAWDHMRFGLRQGSRPHWVGSTTPKPRKLIKSLVKGDIGNVVLTHATMRDNPFLEPTVKQQLLARYSGTSLGAQELEGRIIDQDENALWTREIIEDNRVLELPTGLARISVGVDPSGGRGEQGIVVVGKLTAANRDELPHGYVLADRSCRLSPAGWGRRAIDAAVEFEADNICAEVNYGGDMVLSVIHNALDEAGLTIPVKKLTASRGKRPRAEPVAALAAQGRLHHAGVFPELEDQLCTWTPESSDSPDRLDAMVWGAWETKLVALLSSVARGSFGGSTVARRRIG